VTEKRPSIVLWLVTAVVALWLVAPTLLVIPLSFTDKASLAFPPSGWSWRWYDNFFSDPAWLSSVLSSIRIALLVTLVTALVGTAAALGLTRATFRGLPLIYGLMLAPMIVPVIVLGIGVYALFLKYQLLGTTLGFVTAHTVLALPFFIIPVVASLRGFDRRLEDAAQICGATRWGAFRQVTLPLIGPGVAAGSLFAFVTSFDEVVVALFIQSPYLQTLPVQMYNSVTRDTDPTMAAASTLILILTTTLVVVATYLLARRNRVR
jgi:putative spermidine/putrescine transport system permease protein